MSRRGICTHHHPLAGHRDCTLPVSSEGIPHYHLPNLRGGHHPPLIREPVHAQNLIPMALEGPSGLHDKLLWGLHVLGHLVQLHVGHLGPLLLKFALEDLGLALERRQHLIFM